MDTPGTLGMDKQRLAVLAALPLLPLAAACGNEDVGSESVSAGASASVTGTYWAIEDVTVDGRKSTTPGNAYPWIAYGGKASGGLGGNGFGADATFSASHVTFDQVQTIGMACEGIPADFEQALRQAPPPALLPTAPSPPRPTATS